jgi:hypothetical protein
MNVSGYIIGILHFNFISWYVLNSFCNNNIKIYYLDQFNIININLSNINKDIFKKKYSIHRALVKLLG